MSRKLLIAPSLSICIPAYNRPQWLRRAITSILMTSTAQQPQIEIVISDDSTIPDCKEVVAELLLEWQGSWQYKSNSPSLGMAANWNCCIQMAKGKYVLILHDDDYLESGAPENILKALRENNKVSALLFGVQVVTEKQKIRRRQVVKSQQYLTPEKSLKCVLSDSSFIRFPGIVLRKEIFSKIGFFDEKIGGIADIRMWIRVCKECGLLCIPIITSNYTVHASALTMEMFEAKTIENLSKMFVEVSDKKWLSIESLTECRKNYFHQFILAGTVRYLRLGNIGRARETFQLFSRLDYVQDNLKMKWKILKVMLQTFLALSNLVSQVKKKVLVMNKYHFF